MLAELWQNSQMNNIFLVISIIVGFTSPIIGISSVIWGNFRPQRMTRFLIFLLSLLFVGTLVAQGDKNGIYIAVAQLIGSVVILWLSIKKGIGGWEFTDKVVLLMALISLVVWRVTSNSLLGLIMSMVTDFIGYVPTLIKTWYQPETEEWKFYMSDVISSTFSLLSIAHFSLANTAFPVYILFINALGVVLILGRRKYLKR